MHRTLQLLLHLWSDAAVLHQLRATVHKAVRDGNGIVPQEALRRRVPGRHHRPIAVHLRVRLGDAREGLSGAVAGRIKRRPKDAVVNMQPGVGEGMKL